MSRLFDLTGLAAQKVLPLLAAASGPRSEAELIPIWEAYQSSGSKERIALMGWVDGGEVIALAGLRLTGAGQANLQHLVVSAAHRGRDLGRSLLTGIACELNLWRLDAETDADALGFYRRCGWAWAPLGPQPHGRQRYGVYWLDPEHILQAEFRFPAPRVDQLRLPAAPEREIPLLRLDLIHPLLQGNKWFKLRPHLLQARQSGLRQLVTFGGAWSNHLLATAAAGCLLGFETIAYVRGEFTEPLNPHLKLAQDLGMRLLSLSRTRFRELRGQAENLQAAHPEALIIPEGGASALGVKGAGEILACLPPETRSIALACGTGTTLAGLVAAAPSEFELLGVSVLKGDFMAREVSAWLKAPAPCSWRIETGFHAGGYARVSPELTQFMAELAVLNPNISLEPVYTGKLAWALNDRLAKGSSTAVRLANDRLSRRDIDMPLILHTGGIWPSA